MGIDYLFEAKGTTEHQLLKNLLKMKNSSKKSKNSELNKDLGIKKNINLYILLQIIFPKRRFI